MNFTREPLIESVITPKEGYKLVVRNSKAGGQEEFFVDAVEVISFGNACFLRSLEKPKCFVVPVSDYEILEVRESRMVLKSTATDRGIKIGGGRETSLKTPKEEAPIQEVEATAIVEQRTDKRREKRRSRKRRKGEHEEEGVELTESPLSSEEVKEKRVEKPSLIPPPSTLISETIARYKTPPLVQETILLEKTESIETEQDEEELPI